MEEEVQAFLGQDQRERERERERERQMAHFVLVHSVCHGGWCWYKLVTLLRLAGHQVTALDLGASGIRPEKLFSDEVRNFFDYSQPLITLMESLPPNQRVILVGHSFGGMNISLAMEKFPEKISAAVFVAGFMPDCSSLPSYLLEQLFARAKPLESFLDTEFGFGEGPQKFPTTLLVGPQFLSTIAYQNCSQEDITLGRTLVRIGSLFPEDLLKLPKFSRERYGSVSKVFIICKQGKAISEDCQRWMIENEPPNEVKEITGSDHMPMLSKPFDLQNCLLHIAQTYS